MKDKLRVHLVAAARPNMMKVAPAYHALLRERWCKPILIHTGQHYDQGMFGAFLETFGLPSPDFNLSIGSGSHADQTGRVMMAYEALCLADPPDWVIVVGDVNSTIACALTAKKLNLKVAHLEAGLRSGDRTMPEEINRLATDAIADLLWTPSPDADANLRREGVNPTRIDRIGNIMIDSYVLVQKKIEAARTCERFGVTAGEYGVVTVHRPSNVDGSFSLETVVDALAAVSQSLKLVFPVHPRTRARLEAFDLLQSAAASGRIQLVEPMEYVPFQSLVRTAKAVITDSGGIQEETTYLGIPCLTLRENTERPITIELGTNRLVAPTELTDHIAQIVAGAWPKGRRPSLWDGHTAERLVNSLLQHSGL